MNSVMSEKDEQTLKKFSKIQNACSQLKDSIQIIYDNALSNEELASMSGGSDAERSVVTSAASMISTYLANARTSVDIVKICDYYKYNSDVSDKISYFKQPIISDESLENLVLLDKQFNLSKENKNNDVLKFVGDTWLNSLIAFNLSQRFPDSNEQSLKKLRDLFLSEKNLKEWSLKVSNLKDLVSVAKKINPNITQQEIDTLQVDGFKAYIGGLVLDRGSMGHDDVSRWLNKLMHTKVQLFKFSNLRGLYAYNLKDQLEQFMVGNKSGQALKFVHTISSGVTTVKITLGQTVLAQAEDVSSGIGDKKAASNILSNPSLLAKYSVHQESIPIVTATKYEPPSKRKITESAKNDATHVETQASKAETKVEPVKKVETVSEPIEKAKIKSVKKAGPVKQEQKAEIAQPVISADALTEQIMSQLNAKVASMVGELTSKILQSNNITIAPDVIAQTVSDATENAPVEEQVKEEVKEEINEETEKEAVVSVDEEPSEPKQQPTPNRIPIQSTPVKETLPKAAPLKEVPVNVDQLQKGAAKPVSTVEEKLVLKRMEAKKMLEKTLQKKDTVIEEKKTVIPEEKNVKPLLKKGMPPIPKIGAPLKAMPKMPSKPIARINIIDEEDRRKPIPRINTIDEEDRRKPIPRINTIDEEDRRKPIPRINTIDEEDRRGYIPPVTEATPEAPQKVQNEEVSESNTSNRTTASTESMKVAVESDPLTLPLKTTCDKQAKAKIYEILGRFKVFPEYTTIQLGVADFYSKCSIMNEKDSFLGDGRGSNKKIAEQIAATEALQNENLKARVEERKREVQDLLGVNVDEIDDSEAPVDEVDTYKYFQPEEDTEKLEVYDTCDKSAMADLYAYMGPYRLFPEYQTKQLATNVFHSICSIKNTSVVLAEGCGTTKKISQQISAAKAIRSPQLSEYIDDA